jgi:hypothetical protein
MYKSVLNDMLSIDETKTVPPGPDAIARVVDYDA